MKCEFFFLAENNWKYVANICEGIEIFAKLNSTNKYSVKKSSNDILILLKRYRNWLYYNKKYIIIWLFNHFISLNYVDKLLY